MGIQAQVEGQTAKQKEALYKAALQDLTLFKSRTSAALLQASTPLLYYHNQFAMKQEVFFGVHVPLLTM